MIATLFDKLYFVGAIIGLHIGFGLVLWQIATPLLNQSATVSASTATQRPLSLKKSVISGKPVRLVIPALQLDMAVTEGQYDAVTTKWTLAKDKAFFAAVTAPLNNDRGNSLIYGHNNMSVFRPLIKRPPDASTTMMVYSDNGHIFHYKFKTSYEVQPTDTAVLRYKGPAAVTLQTCVGDWFERRLMFQFDFIRVEKHV